MRKPLPLGLMLALAFLGIALAGPVITMMPGSDRMVSLAAVLVAVRLCWPKRVTP